MEQLVRVVFNRHIALRGICLEIDDGSLHLTEHVLCACSGPVDIEILFEGVFNGLRDHFS
jgi:hypothetical protein